MFYFWKLTIQLNKLKIQFILKISINHFKEEYNFCITPQNSVANLIFQNYAKTLWGITEEKIKLILIYNSQFNEYNKFKFLAYFERFLKKII